MAFRRAKRTTRRVGKSSRSSGARGRYGQNKKAPARKYGTATRQRRAPAKRQAPRTIRIVLEQPQVSAVSRPDQLVPKVEAPKKAKF
jgi:hypothetical protein